MPDPSDLSQHLSDHRVVRVELGPRSYEILITSDRLETFAAELARWLKPHAASPLTEGEPGGSQKSGDFQPPLPAPDESGESAEGGVQEVRTPGDAVPPPACSYKEGERRADGSGRALIVTDRHVASTHALAVQRSLAEAGWTCSVAELQPGEQSKRLDVVSGLYDRLVELEADRQTVVVAVGGGVVGDTAGFVAATYARGLPLIQVPTSLLAQVDSSVGGKVGINHPRGKNLIGAFHQPRGVFVDTATLGTLPDRDYRSGLAEVIKYGVILDGDFFKYLEANVAGINQRSPAVLRYIVARSCRLKADVVEQDEQERTGLRAVLNYGHTFAHAFEALSGYGELEHGEAVALGMVCASRLAERLEMIDSSVTVRQIALLKAVGLPTELPESLALDAGEILDRMRLDKKSVAGRLRFVLPTRLGHVELVADVPETDVRAVLEPLAG